MRIAGFQKCSLIDYPKKICAIVFTQGCNFRCPYCHNPELTNRRVYRELIPEKDILAFLEKRQAVLEGVEISGGEPLLHKDLPRFVRIIKQIGYAVKLDTNGSYPKELKKIIDNRLVDYIAMDIKAPLEKYNFVAGVDVDVKSVERSIRIIMRCGLDYQFRTTVVKALLNIEDLKRICELIKGARSYVLQAFKVSSKIMEESLLDKEQYSDEEIQRFQDMVTNLTGSFAKMNINR